MSIPTTSEDKVIDYADLLDTLFSLSRNAPEPTFDPCGDAADAIEALLDAIATAYGYLWHVNNEPGTPNRYPPARAAYEARRCLRELLTAEQRGEAINRVWQLIQNDGGEK